ncbi:MAG TPA: class I SAM-dependent DNA methyltransferase [Verrucomicrobiae bacterium]|nr:class I SAM-dependent DNA methyltransferase [Verrucomicrobiae bacterium]
MPDASIVRDHQAWLGYLQPDGLVVSPAALADAQAVLDHNTRPLQERFLPFVTEVAQGDQDSVQAIADFVAFARGFLGWPDDCLFGADPERPIPDALSIPLQEFGETLAANFAFRDPRPKDPDSPWLLLIQTLPIGADLDAKTSTDDRGWSASATRKFERLLRETRVPTGLLFNGTSFRLLYAPRGENSGSITFPVPAMAEIAGRPILAALHMLLDRERLLSVPSEARLPALLQKSRQYQSSVSETLAQQVLDALYELLRGFQAADERTRDELLRDTLAEHPDQIYGGLLTTLMRLVFLLFAEDRGLMPGSTLYVRHYSLHGLFERLREDNERHPDTMDHRFGAWAQLLALFGSVHRGCRHKDLKMPARSGHLFDPERYRFLDGRTLKEPTVPLVPDGVVFRVLSKLLILDGERLSYRTLDVEEIGSVYQTVMGFRLEVAAGTSIAIKGKPKKGSVPAATIINLDTLLAVPGKDRPKWLAERTDQELSGDPEKALKAAASIDDVLAALERKIARNATPSPVAKGGLVLQPTDERRRSGSHYTPRSFTQPIVRKTLERILQRLGERPTPEQILALKICDLAVGSAAFLVETCRQLAEALLSAWRHHGGRPSVPPDETEELFAMRLIAQRCLYGVDRNPMAVDLAKLSLWLATLAKDHPFTFLDHAIRPGDSLVGLTRWQIERFTWKLEPNEESQRKLVTGYLWEPEIRKRTAAALRERQNLLGMGDDYGTPQLKHEKLEKADELLDLVRFIGDAAIAAYFSADKDKAREQKRDELAERIAAYLNKGDITQRPTAEVASLRSGEFAVTPFHWEVEFPEVFERENPGFDAFVGNPPYAGKNTIADGNPDGYLDWLKSLHDKSHGNSDLVAHFFRRAFNMLRQHGCFGLIATKTIGQGDTRATGLRWICTHGGTIYTARRRYKWPGAAAVTVSVIHLTKQSASPPFDLDNDSVPMITAYLFHAGGHENPAALHANAGRVFVGSYVLGMGFTFDDTDKTGVANPLALMHELIAKDPRNAERIFPYLGGEEVNDSPTHAHHRYVINFSDFPLRRADFGVAWADAETKQRDQWLRSGVVPLDYPEPVAADWPELLRIVEHKVKPERMGQGSIVNPARWYRFARPASDLAAAATALRRVIAIPRVTQHVGFTFLPAGTVLSEQLVVTATDRSAAFALLQSRPHEGWSRFFASSLEERFRYTPSDCFETFPFPAEWETNAALEEAGREYYEFRAALMVRNNEGLTKTYNRFHDPEERSSEIQTLRDLHARMDAAVLAAYGWLGDDGKTLKPAEGGVGEPLSLNCEFLLDYEDEDEDEDDDETEGRARKRKKPWRYRWPDEVRDEVLARLLKLNAERAKEEQLAGMGASPARPPKGRKRKLVNRQGSAGSANEGSSPPAHADLFT